MDARQPDSGRWAPALHNLYLAGLLIAFLAVVTVEPVAPQWTAGQRLALAGLAAAGLAAVDVAVRHWPEFDRLVTVRIAYFLCLGGTIGILTAICSLFSTAGLGVLPLAFLLLPRLAAVAVGLVVTASPLVLQPLLFGDEPPFGVGYQASYPHMAVMGVALPFVIGWFAALAVQAVHRQSVARQALAAQLSAAGERQRLAHELHDTLAQGLSGVIMQLEAAEQDLQSGRPSLAGRLARAQQTARTCLADTRRAVEALRPEPLDSGTLATAIVEYCGEWSEQTGVPVDAQLRGTVQALPPRSEVAAFRVVQEALANVAKHAAAARVSVVVEYVAVERAVGERAVGERAVVENAAVEHVAGERAVGERAVVEHAAVADEGAGLRLTVNDDGRGFDPAAARGLGLPTMRERVEAAGGSFAVTSSPGAGTAVTARLPFREE
ncbi:MAG TPA: sensor histidine kinase [Candidatus Limnocylindrales bacterium]